jgi:aspartate aminotransferase
MPASPIRKLVPLADSAKARGVHVYHLNIGQPDVPTPREFVEGFREYDEEVLSYGHSQGDRGYIEKLTEYYARHRIEVAPEQIVVTTGGSEAIVFAFNVVASAGDEVIVFEPFYTNYNGFAVMAGIRLIPCTTRAEDGFHLPPVEQIERRITDKTRAIMICSPNNPTGTVLTRRELEGVMSLATKHDLFVLSDEVYREFSFDGVHTSVMHVPGHERHAILLDSVSKRFSACGARVGCLVSKRSDVIDAVVRFGQARLCVATVEQIAAKAALSVPQSYFDDMADEYRRRRDVVIEALGRIPGVICRPPGGAFYVMAKLPISDSDDFAAWMLTDFAKDGATTMVAPGPGFYATPGAGKDEVRIAYVLNVDDLKKAMEVFAAGLSAYREARGLS